MNMNFLNKSALKKAGFSLKIGISGILFFLVLKQVELTRIEAAFHKIHWDVFAIAILVGLATVTLQFLKWIILLNQVRPPHLWLDGLRAFLCGTALGLISPGRMGELGRAFFVRSGQRWSIVELTVIDKISAVLGISIMAIVACGIRQWRLGLIAMSMAALLLSGIIIKWDIVRGIFLRWLKKNRTGEGVSFSISRAVSGPTIALAVLMYSAINIQFYFLANSFEPVAITAVLAVQPLIMLINLVPITLAGLGIREGAAVMMLAVYGVSESTAFNAAFLVFFSNVFVPALLGGAWILVDAIRSGSTHNFEQS